MRITEQVSSVGEIREQLNDRAAHYPRYFVFRLAPKHRPGSCICRLNETTQPQLIRNPERGEQRCSLSPRCCILGGRPQAASLVQGLRPRNAP